MNKYYSYLSGTFDVFEADGIACIVTLKNARHASHPRPATAQCISWTAMYKNAKICLLGQSKIYGVNSLVSEHG